GFAVNRRHAGEFPKLLGSGGDEHELTILGDHDEVVPGQEQLPMSVAAALPLEGARRGVEAGEDALVQTVNEPAMQNRAGLTIFHAVATPDLADLEPVPGLGQLDDGRTSAEA